MYAGGGALTLSRIPTLTLSRIPTLTLSRIPDPSVCYFGNPFWAMAHFPSLDSEKVSEYTDGHGLISS